MRAPGHGGYTVMEKAQVFDAMIAWAEMDIKPVADDVLNVETAANSTYGCAFARNKVGPDDSPAAINTRSTIAPALAAWSSG
ncbi:hypothetical protein [Noviherbaspirillum sp.]|uniref:hypothetical protein n=1 Tax=Noviherbaspirillum sp. TaxID=1926288 RepID=UPI002B492DC1|nr:hypothetical protein [Noviherbaspirillum sp.]HJV81938.1 hypothetical protein [Noviherbaspirillum sp.]